MDYQILLAGMPSVGNILGISFALLVIFIISKGIKVIKQSEAMIVERLGKYSKTLNAGIHIIIPIMDVPRKMIWRFAREGVDGRRIPIFRMMERIDLRETVYDFEKKM